MPAGALPHASDDRRRAGPQGPRVFVDLGGNRRPPAQPASRLAKTPGCSDRSEAAWAMASARESKVPEKTT